MTKNRHSDDLLSQECLVDKKTGKVIEASDSKVHLTRLPKTPDGMEITQVDVVIYIRKSAAKK